MTTSLPNWEYYCEHTAKANAMVFSMPGIDVWFSYKTPIAFRASGCSLIVRQNDWKSTTGKHLSAIDGGDAAAKIERIPSKQFESMLEECMLSAT